MRTQVSFATLTSTILNDVDPHLATALIVSSEPTVRDLLRWAVGEFVDEVLVAVSWTDAFTIAQRRHLVVAVVDFDGITAPRRTWLVDVLAMRSHASIVAVGTRAGLQVAAASGVVYGVSKPIDVTGLMNQVALLVRGR